MAILMTVSTSAAEKTNMKGILNAQECVITVQTRVKQLAGKRLAAYQVGIIEENSNFLHFIITEDFSKTGADLYAVSNQELDLTIQQLSTALDTIRPAAIETLTQDGACKFTVPAGVYLICQMDENLYSMQKSLVSIPQTNAERNDWVYQTTIEPKVSCKADENVKTGDQSNFALWLWTALGSGVFSVLLIVYKKRYKKAQI